VTTRRDHAADTAGLRVLEIGSCLSVAYAGMLLAEQGHRVDKWLRADGGDPVLDLDDGEALWRWLCHRKILTVRHARQVADLEPGSVDVVIDNLRWSAWAGWGVSPRAQAERLGARWVSLRDDFDGRSFDAVAQARAWGEHLGCVPAYLGDTAAGLWLAFKATAGGEPGHYVLRHAALLAKLVEGELAAAPRREGASAPGRYGLNDARDGVRVWYRGGWVTEPLRGERWRRTHLGHDAGRYRV